MIRVCFIVNHQLIVKDVISDTYDDLVNFMLNYEQDILEQIPVATNIKLVSGYITIGEC
jgi:hypothetical protein